LFDDDISTESFDQLVYALGGTSRRISSGGSIAFDGSIPVVKEATKPVCRLYLIGDLSAEGRVAQSILAFNMAAEAMQNICRQAARG